MTVGAVKSEVIKTGAPDWSDSKSISLISVGKRPARNVKRKRKVILS